ncbi:hypothetical protein CLOLEP_00108 [[Clostridium] leptum DSM 753]|uniref:Uncharacterized protein n=1 Tax=[Clostridium] leptum DSM 753 TaxID=428125 RepID=A7VNI3_9FIRM|nr:hypothetical protein CLOLEP_00108 [[Clostridium] leptum DSM 753]
MIHFIFPFVNSFLSAFSFIFILSKKQIHDSSFSQGSKAEAGPA